MTLPPCAPTRPRRHRLPLGRVWPLASLLLAPPGLTLAAPARAAPARAAPANDHAPPEETKPAAGAPSTFTREVQARLPEATACYRSALETQPSLVGRLVVHFTITAKGKVANAVVKDSTLLSPKVETCIRDAVIKWTFTAPDNAQDTHVAVPFDLGPEGGGGPVLLPPGVIARHVLDQSVVAYSAERRVVVYNRCWSAAGGEGCVVVISPLGGGPTTEIPVFLPGQAPDARARQKKETSVWTKVLGHLKGGAFVELARTTWPPEAAELALPHLDIVLAYSKDALRVTRRPARPGAKPAVLGEVKTVPRGKAQPLAVYAAPDQRVMVVALREEEAPPTPAAVATKTDQPGSAATRGAAPRPDAGPIDARRPDARPGDGRPASGSPVPSRPEVKPLPASVTHFEVIDVFR